jgi:hypothetical protein
LPCSLCMKPICPLLMNKADTLSLSGLSQNIPLLRKMNIFSRANIFEYSVTLCANMLPSYVWICCHLVCKYAAILSVNMLLSCVWICCHLLCEYAAILCANMLPSCV